MHQNKLGDSIRNQDNFAGTAGPNNALRIDLSFGLVLPQGANVIEKWSF